MWREGNCSVCGNVAARTAADADGVHPSLVVIIGTETVCMETHSSGRVSQNVFHKSHSRVAF